MQKLTRGAIRLAAILLALLCLYTAALLLAYAIPDARIERNVNSAIGILREEGNMVGGYGNYFFHNALSITDNLTDYEMFKALLRGERTVVQAAMHIDYARYWHGYSAVLRPLSAVLSIVNLRYLNMLLVFGLLGLCVCKCRELLGGGTALCFGAGLAMTFVVIAPFCQQYIAVTLLTLLACAAVLCGWRWLRGRQCELFFVLGSLVCYFDFLTFPLLTLGYPLTLCLLLSLRDGRRAALLWRDLIGLSALWLAGYALTWLFKGVIGGLLTSENVMGDILEQVANRTLGSEGTVKISALTAIGSNLEAFCMGGNVAAFAGLLLGSLIAALYRRAPASAWLRALPVAVLALAPFAWCCVMQNHTRMHFWMTYKHLAITVFASCAALLAVRNPGSIPHEEHAEATARAVR